MGDGFDYWLVSTRIEGEPTPGDDSGAKRAIGKLRGAMGDTAEVFECGLPDLRVGTLDKLMSAGDLLAKVDLNVESVVRKIERQFYELDVLDEVLTVEDSVPPHKYLENFRWNEAKYRTSLHVDQLIKDIVQAAAATELELKESTAQYSDQKQRYQALERQKDGNLLVANLDDKLTPLISGDDIHDSEYLKTVVVIVGKQVEKAFLESYEQIGPEIVGYGPEGERDSKKGSPVVPGSAKKVTTDKEGYSLYLVTILDKFIEEFKVAAQTARFLVRDYDFRTSKERYDQLMAEAEDDEVVDPVAKAKQERDKASIDLLNWCKTHYGEAFAAWVHIKVIRLFVESVLRYGLPVNFAASLVKPKKKSLEKKARDKLFKLYSGLDHSNMMQVHADDAGSEELYPYVSYTINPFGAEKR
ncbi:V-type proton ATPase subunit C (V-ATPase subunit C) (Vacuolar proton pump subunit C) [Durusdinium trenchii]|uniref:V-type proton ATPase subunit C n=1 Tax=Durusdinium trenchii TaxID=1381693 RepID=A0ABP0MXZ4_9DINO